MNQDKRLMSVRDAAAYAAVSYGTIWNAIKRKDDSRLKSYRLAGINRIVIERKELDEWIDGMKEEL